MCSKDVVDGQEQRITYNTLEGKDKWSVFKVPVAHSGPSFKHIPLRK
jgi:hypothetical protein